MARRNIGAEDWRISAATWQSQRARQVQASAFLWPKTWLPCSAPTRRPSFVPCESFVTRDFLTFSGDGVSPLPELLNRVLVVKRMRELVDFCRIQGYHREEVIQMIEGLP